MGRHLLIFVLGIMLMTCLGISLGVQGKFTDWGYERRVRVVLRTIHARQHAIHNASGRFASSFEALRVDVPESLRASLLTPPDGERGFFAELCGAKDCWGVNERGQVRRSKTGAMPRGSELVGGDPHSSGAGGVHAEVSRGERLQDALESDGIVARDLDLP